MRSPLAAIFLIVVVDVLAFTLIVPLLPFYAERFGATPTDVGLLVSAFALCQLVAGPFLGNLSDRIGRKPVLVVSQLGTLLGFLALGHATSLAMVFFARCLDGITAGNLTVAQATIADVTPPERRARAYAVIGVSFGVGFLIGPAAAGLLAMRDVRLPIWCAAGLSALSIILTLLLLPSPADVPPRLEGSLRGERAPHPPAVERRLGLLDWSVYARPLRDPRLAPRLAQYFLFGTSFALFTSGFALFAERRFVTAAGAAWGPREVGYALALSGLLGVILQGGLVARAVGRFGEAPLVVFGFAFQALGLAVLAWSHAPAHLGAVIVLMGLGNAPLRPALTSLVTRAAGPDDQGLVLGLAQSLMSVAQVVAPLASGALIGHAWLSSWALAAAAVSALGALLASRRSPD